MRERVLLTAAASAALVSFGVAQDVPNTIVDAQAFRAPIHTKPSDPFGGDYGLWAAGADYKASFHDGFAFFPVLGESYPENLPLQLKTPRVFVGEVEVTAAGLDGIAQHSEWRFERHRGPVTERYDVRANGVEQSFVIATAPFGATGDLVVRTAVDTALQGPVGFDAVGAMTFKDAAGNAILEYGAALAFDALGSRVDVRTQFDGREIRLVVPADFVASATFPITVDPLITTKIVSGSGSEISSTAIARDDETNRIAVSYHRASSANDFDMWVRLLDDDLSTVGTIFTDVQSRWINERSSLTYVGGANRWAIAYERTFSDASAITVYLHDRLSTTANSGVNRTIIPPADKADFVPSIGGAPGFDSNDRAFVAYRRDQLTRPIPGNTTKSEIHGAIIDCANATIVTQTLQFDWGGDIDRESPCVSQMHGGGTNNPAWCLVWQRRENATGEYWTIRGTLVRQDGSKALTHVLGDRSRNAHQLRPKIDGEAGRYALAWTDRQISGSYTGGVGSSVRMQRLDWADGSQSPVRHPVRKVAQEPYGLYDLGEGRPLSYDRSTDSHWSLAWRRQDNGIEIARYGHDLGQTERLFAARDSSTFGDAEMPSVCFDDDNRRFNLVWRTDGNLRRVHAINFAYPDAHAERFGPTCGSTLSFRNEGSAPPYAGSEFFGFNLLNGAQMSISILVAGVQKAATPIPLPLSNCDLLVDTNPVMITAYIGLTGTTGRLEVDMPIPSTAGGTDLFWQFVQTTPAGITASNGVETRIR